jgi:hypothetical protein
MDCLLYQAFMLQCTSVVSQKYLSSFARVAPMGPPAALKAKVN